MEQVKSFKVTGEGHSRKVSFRKTVYPMGSKMAGVWTMLPLTQTILCVGFLHAVRTGAFATLLKGAITDANLTF